VFRSCLLQQIRTVSSGPIKLVGYSFGACVAVEIALQLQGESGVSSLVLLDGSHTFVASFTGQRKEKLTTGSEDTANVETAVIIAFVSQLALRLEASDSVMRVFYFYFFCTLRNELLNS
jgi:thioesterase domain-containing protein